MRDTRQNRWAMIALVAALTSATATVSAPAASVGASPWGGAGKAEASASTTDLLSRSSGVQKGNCLSNDPATSANGRLVVFESCANNLVAGDTGPWGDVFIRNRTYGNTALLSKSRVGVHGNGGSTNPTISADGRYVVFGSAANNLVAGDTNGRADVFRVDRTTGEVKRVSLTSGGEQGNADSGGGSLGSSISDNGRFVAFTSRATNLTTADDEGSDDDVFVRDMQERKTYLVSRTASGDAASVSSPPEISKSGRYVVFASFSPDIVSGDGNGPDAFVWDRVSRTIRILSAGRTNSFGQHLGQDPSISADARTVAFTGISTEIGGSFQVVAVHLQFSGGVPSTPQPADYELVSRALDGGEAADGAAQPAVNADGTKLAFWSNSIDLVSGDTNDHTDVFLRNIDGSTRRVSLSASGRQGNDNSPQFGGLVDVNASGNTIVFNSAASNLVSGDGNGAVDVFARIV